MHKKLPCEVVDVLTSQLSGDQALAWQETFLDTAYNRRQKCQEKWTFPHLVSR